MALDLGHWLLARARTARTRRAALAAVRAFALAVLLSCGASSAAHAVGADAASVKAAIVYKLLPFVAWPPETWQGRDAFQLCLFDESAVSAALARYEGKPVLGRLLAVRRVGEVPESLRDCHAVMVEEGYPTRLARAVAVARTQAMLVVGEGAGAAARGAMVGMIAEGGRVGFEINRGALRQSRLNASSNLLRLARSIVE